MIRRPIDRLISILWIGFGSMFMLTIFTNLEITTGDPKYIFPVDNFRVSLCDFEIIQVQISRKNQ